MQSLFMKSMLVGFLFAGCNGPLAKSNRIVPAEHQSSSSGDSSDDKCDFSLYAPVRLKQFERKSILKKVQPKYPPEAVEAGIQGRVTVKALVNEKGLIERACAIEGEQVLRKSAENATLQWKLKPRYGLAFIRPKTKKNPKNFAEAYIVFEFKLDKTGSKTTAVALP
jgi:hypothetical protein